MRKRNWGEQHPENPFMYWQGETFGWVGAVTACEQIEYIERFNREECEQALRLDLAKTARTALERRLRKLNKEAKSDDD